MAGVAFAYIWLKKEEEKLRKHRPEYQLPVKKPVESQITAPKKSAQKSGKGHAGASPSAQTGIAEAKTLQVLTMEPIVELFPMVEAPGCKPGCIGLGIEGSARSEKGGWLVASVEPVENVAYLKGGFVFVDRSGSAAAGTGAREYVPPGTHRYKAIWFVYPKRPGEVKVKITVDDKTALVVAPAEKVEKMCKTYGCKAPAPGKPVQVAGWKQFPEIPFSMFDAYLNSLETKAIEDLKRNPSREMYEKWVSDIIREGRELDKAFQAYELLREIYEYAKDLYDWMQGLPAQAKQYLQNWPALAQGIANAAAELAHEIKQDLSPETFTMINGGFFLEQALKHRRDLLDLYDRLRMLARNSHVKAPPRNPLPLPPAPGFASDAGQKAKYIQEWCQYGAKCK